MLANQRDNRRLFAGTAYYYARYRDQFSEDLPDALSKVCHMDRTGCLLDIGTGTGQLAIQLAPYFSRVVAVDPDAEMLLEAARIAESKAIRNISFLQGRGEDMPKACNTYRLITIGSAFHWMDRNLVIDYAYEALETGGVFALIESPHAERSTCHSTGVPIPKERIRKIIEKYLGPRRRAGFGYYSEPEERYKDLLDESPFGGHFRFVLPGVRVVRDIDAVIGFYYSTSFASRPLFGDSIDDFENELRSELLRVSPSGEFSSVSRSTEVIYGVRLRPRL